MNNVIMIIAVLVLVLCVRWVVCFGLLGLLVWVFDLPFTWFQIGVIAAIAAYLLAGR